MKTMMLKACKRCSGDLRLDKDHEIGLYAECLQCGHVTYPTTTGMALRHAGTSPTYSRNLKSTTALVPSPKR